MPAVNSVPVSPFPLPLILSTTGFEPDFFRGSAGKGDQGAGRPAARAGETMRYRADAYPTHAAFCASAEFSLYRMQVRWALDFLSAFCKQEGLREADDIAGRFDLFYENRFTWNAMH